MISLLYCQECGAANESHHTHCFACQHQLQVSAASWPAQPAPVPVNQARLAANAISASSTTPTTLTTSTSSTLLAHGYRLVNQIGQGGFGEVYKARDTRHNRFVAIKQISLQALSPKDIIQATDSYNREVMLMKGLKHANLPRMYDHFTDPEHWYIVLEYIEGETLEEYLSHNKEGKLPIKEVLNIGITLCDVLDYLHAQSSPIIFRDVKPANIIRTPRGRLYLIDFGIARQYKYGQKKDTGVLGSPGYAPPEQYGIAQTNQQSDIYSLGATLQTLLTGIDRSEITDQDAPHQVTTLKIPRNLQLLLDRMLEQDGQKRPHTMDFVKQELIEIKEGMFSKLLKSSLLFGSGILLGLIPFSFWIALSILNSPLFLSLTFSLNTFMEMLYAAFWCLSPFLLMGTIATAITFLLSSNKRLVGLGMLTIIAIVCLAIIIGWVSFPPINPGFGSPPS
ncbi:MAG TPA: serine/threonine-protein kinase [Ktedonobacteraceae bacterium]|nr:serine/threonine-protein kinase [Ktedonobacteraceae bacterium]